MSNVTALPGFSVPISQGEPRQELVVTLEALLAEARAGNLKALAFATYRSNKAAGFGWSVGPHRHDIAAGVIMLQYEFGKILSES